MTSLRFEFWLNFDHVTHKYPRLFPERVKQWACTKLEHAAEKFNAQ